MSDCLIRKATENDSSAMLDIYSHYVENTAASFELETPSPDAFADRIKAIIEVYPCFVCVTDNAIVGYAYASSHRKRAAYRYDVDVSIYIRKDMHGKGIGTALYGALFDELALQNYYNAYAAIALPNEKSIALHRKFGFEEIGVHKKTGYKFGKWHDILWLDKSLKDH